MRGKNAFDFPLDLPGRGSGRTAITRQAGRRRGGRMRTAKKSELGYIAQHKFTYIVNLSVELCYVVAESHFCYL